MLLTVKLLLKCIVSGSVGNQQEKNNGLIGIIICLSLIRFSIIIGMCCLLKKLTEKIFLGANVVDKLSFQCKTTHNTRVAKYIHKTLF